MYIDQDDVVDPVVYCCVGVTITEAVKTTKATPIDTVNATMSSPLMLARAANFVFISYPSSDSDSE